MFHWICPECGREIPPSVMECPACDPKAAPLSVPVEPLSQILPAAPPAVSAEPEIALDPLLLLAEQIRAAQVAEPLPISESIPAPEDLLDLAASVGLSNGPVLSEQPASGPALPEPALEPVGSMPALRYPVPQLNALQSATAPVALLAAPEPANAVALAESDAAVTEFVALAGPLEPVPEPVVDEPRPLSEAIVNPVRPPATEPEPVPEMVATPVEAAAEPMAAAEPEPVLEAVATAVELTVDPTPAAEPEPVLESLVTAVKPTVEPTLTAQPEPVRESVATGVEPTPAGEPEAVATAVEPALEPTLTAEPAPVRESVATAVEPAVEPTLTPEPEPEPVPEAVATVAEPTLGVEPEPVLESVAIPVETAAEPLIAQPELVPEAVCSTVAAPVDPAPEPAVVAISEPPESAAEKPPSGSWLPLAPLQSYSPAASRAIHPAAPRPAILMPDSGPRMTLPGPTLPPDLASFQNANIVAAGSDRRPRRRGVPGWLVTIGVMLALLVAGVGMVFYLLPLPQSNAEAKPTSPDVQAAAAGGASPLARFIEVTGFRFVVDFNKKSEIHYLVVNHSAAELSDVTVYVTLRTAGAKPGQPPLCRFSFRAPSLGPFESREMTSAIEKLSRSITLPEWQELHSEVQVAQ